jgi:hypothetical protein
MSEIGTREVDALQQVLADEHAAVYLLGAVGARIPDDSAATAREVVRDAYEAHRRRRDLLIAMIVAAGGRPVGSATAYDLPRRRRGAPSSGIAGIEGPEEALAAARDIERRSATGYAAAVGSTTGEVRVMMIEALNDAAVRVLALRGTPELFPGAGEYADR